MLAKNSSPLYLFSFVVGFVFGELMDSRALDCYHVFRVRMLRKPGFVLSLPDSLFSVLRFQTAASSRIVPTDLFPREVSDITKVPYSRIKSASMTCLMVTALLTFFGLGRIKVLNRNCSSCFYDGKRHCADGNLLDKKFAFVSVLSPERP